MWLSYAVWLQRSMGDQGGRVRQVDALVYEGGPEWLRMLDAAVCTVVGDMLNLHVGLLRRYHLIRSNC